MQLNVNFLIISHEPKHYIKKHAHAPMKLSSSVHGHVSLLIHKGPNIDTIYLNMIINFNNKALPAIDDP